MPVASSALFRYAREQRAILGATTLNTPLLAGMLFVLRESNVKTGVPIFLGGAHLEYAPLLFALWGRSRWPPLLSRGRGGLSPPFARSWPDIRIARA